VAAGGGVCCASHHSLLVIFITNIVDIIPDLFALFDTVMGAVTLKQSRIM